eukprot:m.30622 g.30622  ORF g.30622 m.30622 type:complete len:145 (-) comp10625_c0_seq1:729-1163(-)
MVRFKSRYFLVSIEVHHARPWKPLSPKQLIGELRSAVAKYHGDFGLGSLLQTLSVKYYCDKTRHYIVRCAREHMNILATTLALITTINNVPCSLQVHHKAGTIRSCQRALIKYNKQQLNQLLASCPPSEREALIAQLQVSSLPA